MFISTGEIPSIAASGDVTADNLRKIGINVKVAVSDSGTMVHRNAAGASSRRQWEAPAVRHTNRGVTDRLHPCFRRSVEPDGPRSPPLSSLGGASRDPGRANRSSPLLAVPMSLGCWSFWNIEGVSWRFLDVKLKRR